MKFKATEHIMPYKWMLVPQKKVMFGLQSLGFNHFTSVRMDKRVELEIEAYKPM